MRRRIENAEAATAENAAVMAMDTAIAIRVIRDTKFRPALRYQPRPLGLVWLDAAALIRISLAGPSRKRV